MKRTIFLVIICLLTATFAHGQSRDVRRADAQLKRDNLAAAKQFIDNAMNDQAALNDAATFVTRAKVYMAIYESQDPEVRALHSNPLEVAFEALNTAKEKDKGNTKMLEIQTNLLAMSGLTYNYAVEAFNANNYALASSMFRRSFDISKTFQQIDTTTLYNSALAAELDGQLDNAENVYRQLIEMNYPQPYLFSSMASIRMEKGDTADATKMVKLGRERFPEDLNLIFTEANIYIFTGKVEEAREILSLAISMDPENPNLHFALAANYDRMAQDTTNIATKRQFAYEEAAKSYRKAIELNPEYFDALYNLGVLYFNEGIRIFEEADAKLRKSPTAAAFREYEQEEKRFQDKWLAAQPYLEKAMGMIDETDPNLEVVVVSLMQLYARTNQPENLTRMQDIYHQRFAKPE